MVLALLIHFQQACKSEPAKSDISAQPAAQTPSPQPTQQPGDAVPAPSAFNEVFVGLMDDKHVIRMELERKDSNLSGSYYYDRTGAFNAAMRMLELKGQIDKDGNVTLTETTYKTDKPQKTGEFKGKLDGLSSNGMVRLRFSGEWTAAGEGKKLPFTLQQQRFDLGAWKIEEKKQDIVNKNQRYQIETKLPRLAAEAKSGADPRVEKFNKSINDFVAANLAEFKKAVEEDARLDASSGQAPRPGMPPNSMNVNYEVFAANKDFISILFSFIEFTGGAHPNTTSRSFNYDLNRNAVITLPELFVANSNYLQIISEYSIRELKKLETVSFADEGAGPKLENFHSWNITPTGLNFTFDRYQVGPYATGEHQVVVPYSVLKPVIKPGSLLAQVAK